MVEIPVSSIDRIIRRGGAGRVSKSAIEALQKELEEYGVSIAKLAWEFASYAGKKTLEGKNKPAARKQVEDKKTEDKKRQKSRARRRLRSNGSESQSQWLEVGH